MSYKLQVTKFCFSAFLHFCFSAFCMLPCAAQTKFGHVDYSEIMKNMPGIDSAQKVVSNYYAELQTIGEQMAKEVKEKEAAYEKLMNTPGTSSAILKIRQDELASMYKRFQEFSQSAEGDLRDKQLEVLEPFQKKLLDTIKKVAKAHNYSYVFDISTLLFSSVGDDLTSKVKAELGMK